ncbi:MULTISPECIES: transcription-repair coupling factor [unclassified Fibrobacter]|uniref:transcription-repair coupling factor n=1 Tax=unclassified Fibrobacter TaxID=2634177 RepID=UPI000D6BD317|nr:MULTISPECIES: transcription-repair coupling factor [unclassified Fibrobacter]PWJ67087.1 transcription-repair coupling factor [Fibrobacter sp. UWR4]PZW70654.1 transcription-repair coupling factor [Fibrobacter sp. UWR1]
MDSLSEFLTFTHSPSLSLFKNVQGESIHVNGTTIPVAAMMVAVRFQQKPEHILIIAKDYKSGESWVENLESMVGEDFVRFLPSIGLKPYEKKVPFEGVLEERLKFFRDLERNESPFITVCPLDAFLMRLPAPGSVMKNSRTLKVGDVFEPSTLRPWLMDHGFVEQPVVSGVGEFSIRGCIVDVNCLLYPHPIRIEFFGDEIESIRSFDIFSQRSVEKMNSVQLFPMGEFVIPERELATYNGENAGLWWKRGKYEKLDYTLLDYLPKAPIVFEELSVLSETATKYFFKCENDFQELRQIESDTIPPNEIWLKMGEVSKGFMGRASMDLTRVNVEDGNWHDLHCRVQDFSSNGTDAVAKQIEEFTAAGGSVYVVAPTPGGINRLKQVFSDLPIEEYIQGNLSEGFWLEEDNVAFLTETRIFNRHSNKTRKRKVSGSVSGALMIESLNRGDFVAHEDHGVGKYLGLVRVEVNGGMVDCALLEYEGGDRLKFPVADLQKIERLDHGEEPPKLDKLGGKSWENLKKRVKQKVIQIARDLVELYAKREMIEGFAFPHDGKLQVEFEEAFEYEPTPDQVKATAEIKQDMESRRPMDRLVCGDVGFGKTEVAMRAAFKCVVSKKQVALLVPTTILAAQHYENFMDRFAGFGVNIALVNRYKTAKEKKDIFKQAEEGKIDILIGTHALLSEKNKFKDLGLLIIDEEQKFGVKQKEKLRELRLTVDSLSMSATPIPRSLHLSMTGVRDISLINTPPINRLPVETTLMKRDDEVIKNAILDELARGGQVFIVNDRVHSIYTLADEIEALVPNATIGVAHGQMDDRDLENAMDAFLSKKFDILISTSIIESGLDVPNANTIIIMNAHHFGISQLYQMRGRVGRSSVLAKALLVVPAKHEISAESMRRLKALEQFTDLGSGYQLAMRDLEIRGAGNLLGQEQHGFIAEVGFETYVRLVKEAVEMLRGGPVEKPIQTRVELGVDAYLPEDYIQDGLTRIDMYQRIARITHTDEIQSIAQELEDRFGPVPDAAKMLLLVTEVGLLAGRLRIQGLVQRKGMLAATFVEFPPPDVRIISEMYGLALFPMRILAGSPMQVIIELGKGTPKTLAENALKQFRSFAVIKAQAATIQPKNPLLAGIGEKKN